MKNFLIFILVLLICIVAGTAKAADKSIVEPKTATEWTDKDIRSYIHMVMGKFLSENSFDSSEDVRTSTTTHMAAGMQILRNDGIIYQFDIVSPEPDGDKVTIIITVFKEVDSKGFAIKFLMENGAIKRANKQQAKA